MGRREALGVHRGRPLRRRLGDRDLERARARDRAARAAANRGRRASRRSSRGGRAASSANCFRPSSVSRTIEARRSRGRRRDRDQPARASFWTSWVTLPFETSSARDKRAHRHALGMALERGEHVEPRQGRCRARRSGAAPPSRSPSCSESRRSQSAHARSVAERAVMLLADRRALRSRRSRRRRPRSPGR